VAKGQTAAGQRLPMRGDRTIRLDADEVTVEVLPVHLVVQSQVELPPRDGVKHWLERTPAVLVEEAESGRARCRRAKKLCEVA
jgi:hypothetical protein